MNSERFNVKKYTYENSTEFRIYSQPFIKSVSNSIDNRTRWQEVEFDGELKQINEDGVIRDNKSIENSRNSSLNRSKQKIMEYARANNWEWFYTLTFNPTIIDSFDYGQCYKAVHTFFNNVKKRKAPDIKYLVVPEQHKSGRWHFHGLVSNVDGVKLTESNIEGVFNIDGFKYGYTTATRVKDTKRVSTYISKYITKDLVSHTKDRHRYIKSNNLKEAVVTEYYRDSEYIENLKMLALQDMQHVKTVEVKGTDCKVMYINVNHNMRMPEFKEDKKC